MEATRVEDYVKLLNRSRLFSEKRVGELCQQWEQETAPIHRSVASLADWMVRNNHLTSYQANALRHGQCTFVLDEYTLLDRIGIGRMAGVYRAKNSRGMPVAIKILPPSRARDPESLARFEREAKLSLKLNHPNVIRCYHAGERSGLHYLAMEFLPGETLDQVLERRVRLPAAEAFALIAQAFDGLQHLHEQKMVHRDLKPDNLMLIPPPTLPAGDTTVGYAVKILDVGLGRSLFEETTEGSGKEEDLTRAGALLGLPDYLAPEQAKDAHAVDIRADIYSLGCVLYHTLTGQVPFPEKNAVRMLVAHATQPPRPLQELLPGENVADLQRVLDWLMAKDPAQRPSTPAEAAAALRSFYQRPATPAAPVQASAPAAAAASAPALSGGAPIIPMVASTQGSMATKLYQKKRRGAKSGPWLMVAIVLLFSGGILAFLYAVQNKIIILQAPASKGSAGVPATVPAATTPAPAAPGPR